MKALSVRPPWAGAIIRAHGPFKDIENRSWYTRHRGTIAIHASTKIDMHSIGKGGDADILSLRQAERSVGHILGTIDLVDVHQEGDSRCHMSGCFDSVWSQSSGDPIRPLWHWELDHPREFVTPIRSKGALQFWDPSPSVAALIEIAEYVQ